MTTNNIRRSCVDCASAGCDHCSFEEAISAESSAFPAFCKTRDLDPAILEEIIPMVSDLRDTYSQADKISRTQDK